MPRIALVGPAGTGKTTLLASLAALRPDIAVVPEAARELGGLGLALSERSGGLELAGIALRQKVREDRVGSGNFVTDRSAVDIAAFAQELSRRPTASPLDRALADTVEEFAARWLASEPYTHVVHCCLRFVARPIERDFQCRLDASYTRVLAGVSTMVVRLEAQEDYERLLAEEVWF